MGRDLLKDFLWFALIMTILLGILIAEDIRRQNRHTIEQQQEQRDKEMR